MARFLIVGITSVKLIKIDNAKLAKYYLKVMLVEDLFVY